MLVLTRKLNEELVLDGKIRIRILDLHGGKVRLGIVAPRDVVVDRAEVHDRHTQAQEAVG